MVSQRMVTSSRRAGRVTNKTKLYVVRGTKEADLGEAEIIVWEEGGNGEAAKSQHVGAKGVESGELLVSWTSSFSFFMHRTRVQEAVEELWRREVGGGRGKIRRHGRGTFVLRASRYWAVFNFIPPSLDSRLLFLA